MATPQFNYTYKPLAYTDAQKQVQAQLDPLFNRAVQNVNTQKYQNDVQSGQIAAARGLAHSGLAADMLNKNAIAAQGSVADLNAQKATQTAQLAQDLLNQDKTYNLQNRSQLYNEWMGQQNLANNLRDYNYQVGRDKVGDAQWQKQYDYTKYNNDRNYNYQVGRDKVGDSQWQKQYDYTKANDTRNFDYQKAVNDRNYNYQLSQDKLANYWKNLEWNQLSPADKAKMALQYSYAKKSSGGGGGGSTATAKTASAQDIINQILSQLESDTYKKMRDASPKASQTATSGIMSQPGSYWYARGYGSKYLPN